MRTTSHIAGSAVRVLVVDDESDNRELIEVILLWEGFAVELAPSGKAALEMVAKQHPHIILLDLMMPGMDGYQVTTALRADPSTKDIPVMLVTALSPQGPAGERARRVGAQEILMKPFDRDELTSHVKALLEKTYAADYTQT